jgi:carboxypeptidase D
MGVALWAGLAWGQMPPDPLWQPPPAAGPRLDHPAYVDVRIADRTRLDALIASGFDVTDAGDGVATLYTTPAERSRLQAEGYIWSMRRDPAPKQTDPADGYLTAPEVEALLRNWAAAYGPGNTQGNPEIARLELVGRSVEDRPIHALWISDHPGAEEDEPEFKYVSTMHGDEPVGTDLCMYFIERLLADYGADPRVTALVDETALCVVPLMNPDGHAADTRQNAQGFDLNRSFPVWPGEFSGTVFDGAPLRAGGRPPEVAAIMAWTAANRFVLSANLHTGALLVNYPYDDDDKGSAFSPTPDQDVFVALSLAYSSENPDMFANSPYPQGVTNGAAWFQVEGGMQDWNYRYAACFEVTLELYTTKRPSASLLPAIWQDNRDALLAYAEQVHRGVRGIVTDARTGLPLSAEVRVEGNAQPVFTDPDVGDYHRLLLPGTYTLAVWAPGYARERVEGVVVGGAGATRVDVALDPAGITGDQNGDGRVDALDVQMVINAVLGLLDLPAADLDGNGRADAVDVQRIINAVLGR